MIIVTYDRTGSQFASVELFVNQGEVIKATSYDRHEYRNAQEFIGMPIEQANEILLSIAEPPYKLVRVE